jgi:hypothetical protein
VHAVTAQALARHAELALGSAHAWSHPPQWALSVRVSTSQPVVLSSSQFAKFGEHVPAVHSAARHTGSALIDMQVRPHTPQSFTVVVRSVSQPSSRSALQLPTPLAHES